MSPSGFCWSSFLFSQMVGVLGVMKAGGAYLPA